MYFMSHPVSCSIVIVYLCIQEHLKGFEQGEIDNGEIVECLIEHKREHDVDPKCLAGIEHHQIVNMQSYNFNTKFREACKKDYERYCVHKTNRYDNHCNASCKRLMLCDFFVQT